MSTPKVTTTATRYAVSALPADHIDADVFTITVEYRSMGDGWCVFRFGRSLDAAGKWGYEYTRFDLETALRLAEQMAPKLTVNGHSVADVLARAAS
jgi:hypothetical protein